MPVAPAMHVPLGILPALTVAVIDVVDLGWRRRGRRDHSGAANTVVRAMRRGVGPRRSAAAELTHPAQQSLQAASLPRRHRRLGSRTDPSTSEPSPSSASSRVQATPSPTCDGGRGCLPYPTAARSACAVNRLRALITPKLAGGSATSDHRPRPATRPANLHGWRGRDRSATERDTAAAPRSPPARAGLRRPDTSWPAPAAERACARRRARGHRPLAATPAPSPTRAADGGSRLASTNTVMPSVHAGSPAVARRHRDGATGQRRRQQAKPLRTVVIDRRRARLHTAPHSLTKYLFHRSVRSPTTVNGPGVRHDRLRRSGRGRHGRRPRARPPLRDRIGASRRVGGRQRPRRNHARRGRRRIRGGPGRRRDHGRRRVGRGVARLGRQPRGRRGDRAHRRRAASAGWTRWSATRASSTASRSTS